MKLSNNPQRSSNQTSSSATVASDSGLNSAISCLQDKISDIYGEVQSLGSRLDSSGILSDARGPAPATANIGPEASVVPIIRRLDTAIGQLNDLQDSIRELSMRLQAVL